MSDDTLPVYEVEEISLKDLLLALASEQEKQQTIYGEASARLLALCA